ncbi:MAG: TlpA family protein disulfide reductase [Bacteroidetes bacterium]|nr:TlpA family protein disulfide reductase [Bacteroidota bacterium]MCH8524535.1 TlpA family protein disulfide reductase [Balneolales bacterium]
MKTVLKFLVGITILALVGITIADIRSNRTSVSGSADYLETIENASFVSIQDGETRINVSDFEGKLVLVDFWETWCVPCLNSMPTFQQILDEFPDQFVVLAVSPGWSDEMEDVRRFMANHDYEFIFVYDDTGVATKLEISGIPYKVFIGPDGRYISTEMGSGGHQRDYAKILELIQEHTGVALR